MTRNLESGAVSNGPPVDLSDGRLWLLGGSVPATEELSWLPPDAEGYQAINCYAIVEDDEALLIDTGIGAHGDLVLEQLDAVVGRDKPLGIYFTRIEPDCLSNLGRVASSFNLTHVFAIGLATPFDFFDDLRTQVESGGNSRFSIERRQHGDMIEVGGQPRLVVLRPLLRILPTSWGYDPATRTMFTSDAFGHMLIETEDARRIIDADSDRTTRQHVARHLFAKFQWLADAEDPSLIARNVEQLFETHPVESIAPTHGAVIRGSELVRRHKRWFVEAITAGRSQ